MIRLDDLALFVRSAALGGFSGAAREADLLPGQVSAAIQRLERHLDVRLFARSTRSLRLTAEGERYLPFAQEALLALRDGRERLHGTPGELRGTLLVATPSDLGRNVLLPWLAEFRRAHPALHLRVSCSDQVADVFRDPVDVAIRYSPGADANYIALPLAPANRRVLVASPAYLDRAGSPATLDDLVRHDCLLWTLGNRVHDKWSFHDGAQRRVVRVRGPLDSDDGEIARKLALAGEGIAYKSWLDVRADVQAGRLVRLLPQVQGEAAPLHLVCPHRKQFSPAVQALHGWLRARCDALGEAPPAVPAP
ncbi:MAG TPA: LysR family transcriptional regulator [Ramlibacter sp.]|jgi:DNA-binding transcriptional LysR family regulator|uniref:LysR family transcriptional regulator n=1 Tax=Ramlibacter sp. TaxID=1917967 RepID=UPI002D508930|nr:LysR family transcriptional regulator [Ramlibacter sp.]HZY18998.1 LysR family transcriptional regulator [Ramlibacter sp.]